MEDTLQNGPWTPSSFSGSEDHTDVCSDDGRRLSPGDNTPLPIQHGLITTEQPNSSPAISEHSNDSLYQSELDLKKPQQTFTQIPQQVAQYDIYRSEVALDPYHLMTMPAQPQQILSHPNSKVKTEGQPTIQHLDEQFFLQFQQQQQQQQQQLHQQQSAQQHHLFQQQQHLHHLQPVQILDFSKPPPPSTTPQSQGSPYGSVKDEPVTGYTPLPSDSDSRSTDSGYYKQTPTPPEWVHPPPPPHHPHHLTHQQAGFQPFWTPSGVAPHHPQLYNPAMMGSYKPPLASPLEAKTYPMSDVPHSPLDSDTSRDSNSSFSRDSFGSYKSSASPYDKQDSERFKKRTRRQRTSFNKEQLDELERLFDQNQYVDTFIREDLGHRMNLREDVIRVWFKNRRAKQKRSMKKFSQDGMPPPSSIPSSLPSPASLPMTSPGVATSQKHMEHVQSFPQPIYAIPNTLAHPQFMPHPGFQIHPHALPQTADHLDRKHTVIHEVAPAH